MDCFIKKVFQKRIDDNTHNQFVRFGKGQYGGKALISFQKTTDKVKIKSSFEFANDFVELVSELADIKFSGIILSRVEIDNIFINNKIDVDKGERGGIYSYNVNNINSNVIKQIKDKIYFMLLDSSNNIILKIKKKLPKPGKGEGKVDDKFCQLEADMKYWNKIKEAFFWDIQDCKKAKINHIYIITDIIMPKGEKDFEKLRILAKRKGRLIRKIDVDGRQMKEDREMEA